MNLDIVIAQVKSLVPLFAGNVAGAAAYARGVEDQVWLPTPAAYVVPLDEEASENLDMTGLQQLLTERVGIIVQLDNTGDRRGQGSSDRYDATRTALFGALLNFRPDFDPADLAANREARGFYYAGGRMLAFDRARLFYEWDFALDITVTENDGFRPAGVALTEVTLTLDTALPYSPTGAFVPPPQAPPYTPVPPPRTTGPDGRQEGALDLPLTGG